MLRSPVYVNPGLYYRDTMNIDFQQGSSRQSLFKKMLVHSFQPGGQPPLPRVPNRARMTFKGDAAAMEIASVNVNS